MERENYFMLRPIIFTLIAVLTFFACKKDDSINTLEDPCECAQPGISGPQFPVQLLDSSGNNIVFPESYEDSLFVELLINFGDTTIHAGNEEFSFMGNPQDSVNILLYYQKLNEFEYNSCFYRFKTPFGESSLIEIQTDPGTSPESCCAYPFVKYLIDGQDTIYAVNDYPFTRVIQVSIY